MRFRGVFRIFCVGMAIVLALSFSGAVSGAVKDNIIEDVPGFRFENIVYAWDKIILDVVNMTHDNGLFGGTMIFLDHRGRPTAKAVLLPKKVAGMSAERYTAHLVEGSGEAARRASRVIWDFGTR